MILAAWRLCSTPHRKSMCWDSTRLDKNPGPVYDGSRLSCTQTSNVIPTRREEIEFYNQISESKILAN